MAYQIKHYRMEMEGRCAITAASLMGLALFLRVFYYFGLVGVNNVGALWLIMGLILPLALEIGFVVLLKGIRLNAPGLYGIIGAAYCLLLLIQSFQYGSVVRIVLGILAYLICGGLVFVVSGGWLSKEIGVTALFATAAIRFFVFCLGKYIFSLSLVAFLPEAAALCGICALGVLVNGLKEPRASE